jgi:hypothetical protein
MIGALGWWIWAVAGGCDKESEVQCGWQPVLVWIQGLLLVAVWLAGVGTALLLRQLMTRDAR